MQCSNNLKQLGLAVHNFESTYGRLPNYQDDPVFAEKRFARINFLYALLPFVEQAPIFDTIMGQASTDGIMVRNPGGTADTGNWRGFANTSPFTAQIEAFLCPSDSNGGRWTSTTSTAANAISDSTATKTNYRGSMADMIARCDADFRSSSPRSWLRNGPRSPSDTLQPPSGGDYFRDYSDSATQFHNAGLVGLENITDGTSNTVLMTEGVIWDGTTSGGAIDFRANVLVLTSGFNYDQGPQNCLNLKGTGRKSVTTATNTNETTQRPGNRAFETYRTYHAAVFTLLPPNSPSCGGNGTTNTSMAPAHRGTGGVSASSEHKGGVNVVFADGAVRFVPDTIHTKNLGIAASTSLGGANGLDWVPHTPHAATAGGTDAVANQPFSYGVWAELGAINDGAAPAF